MLAAQEQAKLKNLRGEKDLDVGSESGKHGGCLLGKNHLGCIPSHVLILDPLSYNNIGGF
jgi:hypothetical protein